MSPPDPAGGISRLVLTSSSGEWRLGAGGSPIKDRKYQSVKHNCLKLCYSQTFFAGIWNTFIELNYNSTFGLILLLINSTSRPTVHGNTSVLSPVNKSIVLHLFSPLARKNAFLLFSLMLYQTPFYMKPVASSINPFRS